MRVADEFRIKTDAGHEVILQHVTSGISYLDFGNTHLPRDFQGYRVKHTNRTVEPLPDGTYKDKSTGEIYKRL
jgi:hypothetical protein